MNSPISTQTEFELVLRLIVAALLGAMVGLEREQRKRNAGVRTFAAVALGACAFSIVSFVVTPQGNETTRIAAQIVTGVGFLGAGVILHSHGHVSGLTTAATLWATAAVGMAVGYGLYVIGTATAVLLLVILLLRRFLGEHGHDEEGGL